MKGIKRLLAVMLAVVLMLGLLPAQALAAEINDPGYLEISDGYLSVKVSKKNGGFLIDTVEGNQLKKSDDNKFLLYPDDHFDTSYTSFRVTRGGEVQDYIFGRDYGFLGANSSEVELTATDNSIVAVWSVDGLTFTQTLTLLDLTANQHGMAFITYEVENAGEDAEVQARVLMDTALGYQDYALYELTQSSGEYLTVENEQILGGDSYVSSFFCYDDEYSPAVMAYTVNATVNNRPCQPTRVAFGHWNNLASTVFDFTADSSLYFTSQQNKYLTADSAYALYYDMGTVVRGGEGSAIGTYYGVYSNANVPAEDQVAINFEMPAALELNEEGGAYRSLQSGDAPGTFTMSVKVTNISAKTIETLAVAIYPEDGLISYSTMGEENLTATYSDPYYVTIENLIPGEERQVNISFKAVPLSDTQYRKIAVRCFDIHGTNLHLLEEKVLGERDAYVLCPGAAGDYLSFTSAAPGEIYISGTRSLFLTGTNFALLRNTADYQVVLRSLEGSRDVIVPSRNVFVDTDANTIELVLEQEMSEGTWQVIFDWVDNTKQDATGEALRFVVSSNPSCKNATYGILVIEESFDTPNKYRLFAYASEEDYEAAFAYTDPMDLNLMEFRGSFTLTYAADGETIIGAKATALEGGDSINISNCLDVDNGTLEITVNDPGTEDQEILVDIDGEVYTTGARTKVWNGVCALTAIGNGTILSKYNQIGKHVDSTVDTSEANMDTIMLCWPGAASGAQTLAGMVMEFRYAEFGRMFTESEKAEGESKYVIAFGAEISPDFLVPNTYVYNKANEAISAPGYEQMALAQTPYPASQIRDVNERNREEIRKIKDSSSGSLSLAVHDILFGGGFIGFNVTVDVALPSYMDGMPGLEGSLNMKVMGSEWAMNVKGSADFAVFEMEGELGLRSYNSIPVPDKLYFYMGGVTPGVNVDCMGIFWIRGAGGGVDKIYETIFTASVLPPLTLMLKGQVALFSVLSATGELALSARGFSAGISDLGVDVGAGEVNVLDYLGMELYWYPKIKFGASIQLDILDIIYGNGSLLLQETDNGFFWEGFATAGVKVPGYIPFIANMNIGSVDFGVNQERIWGAAHVLKLDAGITYYWGGDVEFAFGKYDAPEPTVSTRSLFSTPVYTDENGDTLYMAMLASTQGLSDTIVLSNGTKTENSFTLDSSLAGIEDAMVSVEFPANTLTEAKTIAVTIGDQPYELVWMDTAKAADDSANADANAIITFDRAARTASVTFSITENFGSKVVISTPNAATVSVYGMPRMADLTGITVSNGTAFVEGDLSQLDALTIYADNGNGEHFVLYEGAPEAAVTLEYPANMPSGTYTIRAVGTTEDQTANPIVEQTGVTYTNPNAPSAPGRVSASLGGDYTIDVQITAPSGSYDGYLVTIYNADGTPTIYQNMLMDKDLSVLTVGGQYTTTVDGETITYGLEAGKQYTVGVSAYTIIEEGIYLPSREVISTLTMTRAEKPKVTLSAENAVSIDGIHYVGSSDVTINIDSDETLKNCKYMVDDGGDINSGDDDWTALSGNSIELTDLSEGSHKITLRGEDAQGDGFEVMYTFTVRATAPVLMLASPSAGEFYGETVEVSGITDPGGTVCVRIGSGSVQTTVADDEGRFALRVAMDTESAYQELTVWAENFLGNESRKLVLPLTNSLLGAENLVPVILADGQEITNITTDHNGKQLALGFRVTTEAGRTQIITINPDSAMANRILWDVILVEGEASVSEDGVLSGITENTNGMVRAQIDSLSAGTVIGEHRNLLRQDLVMEETITKIWDGEPFSFTISATGAAEGSTITYSSDDPTVATVDAATGLVTVLRAGTVTITATASAVDDYLQTSVSCVLTVGKAAQPLTFGTEKIVVKEDVGTVQVTATGAVEGSTLTYSSSDPSIASIDSNGLVTIHKAGTVTITATASEVGDYAETSVSVTLVIESTTPETKTYTVTFNMNGHGEAIESQTITEGGKAAKPTNPTADGFSFSGWYTDAGCTTVYDFDTPVTSDITLYAKWTENTVQPEPEPPIPEPPVPEPPIPGEQPEDPEQPYAPGEDEPCDGTLSGDCPAAKFTDVDTGHWYHEAVDYVLKNGLMNGTGNETFEPNSTTTRAQIVTILWRLEGKPVVNYLMQFEDVASEDWYTEAVRWAASENIVDGYGDGKFGPNDPITRQQMAAILYRYCQYKGIDVSVGEDTNILSYADAFSISEWAIPAMQWACGSSMIQGVADGDSMKLDPSGSATRAQIATILWRFCQNVLKN